MHAEWASTDPVVRTIERRRADPGPWPSAGDRGGRGQARQTHRALRVRRPGRRNGRTDRGDPDRVVARARDRRGLRRRSSASSAPSRSSVRGRRVARGGGGPRPGRCLEQATGIFMTGGNQLKLSGIVNGTAFGEAIQAAHARGVVVGGTSAGASIQSSHMVAFGSGGSTPKQRMTQLAGRPGADPRRRDRPALRPAQPLRPAADARRAEPATCSASASTRTPAR